MAACLLALVGCTRPKAPTPAAAASVVVPALPEGDGGSRGKFLVLSDLHFDPFLDPAIVSALTAAEASAWHGVLEGSSKPGLSSKGKEDTNFRLLQSALDAAKATVPDPDFVILPGDFFAHDFPHRYAEATGDKGRDGLPRFAAKTLEFLASEIGTRFSRAPVLPVLGNNDATCGDYRVEPGGSFLQAFAKAFEPLVTRGGGAPDFAKTFAAAGHYTAKLPIDRPTFLVAFDSVVWSARYRDDCGTPHPRAGQDELDWLRATVDGARRTGSEVWLASHIPPGVDVYKTLKGNLLGGCPITPVSFYAEPFAAGLLDLVRTSNGTITRSFGGHTHNDDFRLLPAAPGLPPVPHKITPSISPLFGNAPAFLAFVYRRDTGAIVDYAEMTLGGGAQGPEAWGAAYVFSATYGASEVSGASLAETRRAMDRAPGLVRSTYAQSSGAGTVGPWRAFACGTDHLTPAEFSQCYCNPPGSSDPK